MKKNKILLKKRNIKKVVICLSIAAIIPTTIPFAYFFIAPLASKKNENNSNSSNDNNNSDSSNNNGNNNENNGGNTNGGTGESNKPNPAPPAPEGIDTSYFKNSLDPIIGNYDFATYNSSTQKIIPSNGPSRTYPSDGITGNQKLSKGYLYDQKDIDQSKRTFGLAFVYNSGAISRGTGWILDYKIPDNSNEYPTTWYFATNVHVLQNLKVKNDPMSPSKYDPDNYTTLLQFTTISDPKTDVNFGDSYYNSGSYNVKWVDAVSKDGKQNLKTIFMGTDYLKTSPGMYSDYPTWKNNEEYIDFAVIEVTFNSQDEARNITSNYADNKDNQFKYKKESLVKNQSYLDDHTFRVLGYPALITDFFSNNAYTSLYSNVPYGATIENANSKRKLGTTPWYKSFENNKSTFDAALGLSFFGFNYNTNKTENGSDYENVHYCSWGLTYPVDNGNLGPGSSGSMLMDNDGYTWGIHFAGDDNASTGLAQALYCEGYSYNGKLGSYNLEGYDLIGGGFPNQKKSYKDSLKQLYGSSYKTNIFSNGLN